jgi:hypothetical protein
VTYRTLASPTIAGAAETTFLLKTLSPSVLVSGPNLAAVEIHQSATNSPDISFDFELKAVAGIPFQPSVSASQAAGFWILSWPATAGYFRLLTATNLGSSTIWLPETTAPILSNDHWVVPLPSTNGPARYYRLQTQ